MEKLAKKDKRTLIKRLETFEKSLNGIQSTVIKLANIGPKTAESNASAVLALQQRAEALTRDQERTMEDAKVHTRKLLEVLIRNPNPATN